MSYLFYVDEKNNAVLHPEIVKLIPSFRALSEKEVLFIVLCYDYHSPYKQHPEHQRKRKAMLHAFDYEDKDLIESSRMQVAITDYISLQYDRRIETARGYEKKIDNLVASIQEEDNPKKIREIDEAVDSLQRRIRALQNEVSEQIQKEGVVKGNAKLSYIEKVMSNRKHFLAVTAKKT